jgi:hypothetical protein
METPLEVMRTKHNAEKGDQDCVVAAGFKRGLTDTPSPGDAFVRHCTDEKRDYVLRATSN